MKHLSEALIVRPEMEQSVALLPPYPIELGLRVQQWRLLRGGLLVIVAGMEWYQIYFVVPFHGLHSSHYYEPSSRQQPPLEYRAVVSASSPTSTWPDWLNLSICQGHTAHGLTGCISLSVKDTHAQNILLSSRKQNNHSLGPTV